MLINEKKMRRSCERNDDDGVDELPLILIVEILYVIQ